MVCSCVVQYDNWTTPTVVNVLRQCADHTQSDPIALFMQLKADVTLWQRVMNEELVAGNSKFGQPVSDDPTRLYFRQGTATWRFINGVLELTFTVALTTQERNQIRNRIQQRFGSSVVIL